MADSKPNAYDLLSDLCCDLLDMQIGTLVFWKSERQLAEDYFAEYVHHWLLEASWKMGWQHCDSSKVWERKP